MPNPVLLVHGWAGSFDTTWRRSGLVDLLVDAGRRVIPFDLPGHGVGPKSHDPNDYRNLADSLLESVIGETQIDAVGFSLGGMTLLEAICRKPQLFGRAVIAGIGDGVLLPHDPVDTESIISGLEGRADPTDKTARLFGKIGNEPPNDPLALAAILKRPRSNQLTPESISQITCPILLVLGDSDFSLPATNLQQIIPRAELSIVKGADHFRTPETFDFLNLVLRFLGD